MPLALCNAQEGTTTTTPTPPPQRQRRQEDNNSNKQQQQRHRKAGSSSRNSTARQTTAAQQKQQDQQVVSNGAVAFGIWHGYIPHPPRHRDATCTACSYGGPAPAGPYGRALVSDSVFGPPSAASPITTSDCTRRRYAGRGTQHHSTNMAVTSPVQTFNLAPSSNQHYLRSKAGRPGVPINWFCICLTGAPLVPTPCL